MIIIRACDTNTNINTSTSSIELVLDDDGNFTFKENDININLENINSSLLLPDCDTSSNKEIQGTENIWERPAETDHRARAVPFSRKRRSV